MGCVVSTEVVKAAGEQAPPPFATITLPAEYIKADRAPKRLSFEASRLSLEAANLVSALAERQQASCKPVVHVSPGQANAGPGRGLVKLSPLCEVAPDKEEERIKAVHQLQAAGSSSEAEQDSQLSSIVELLRQTYQVDFAFVTLIDGDRQYFQAKAGHIDLDSTDRQSAFGSWVLSTGQAQTLVVEDAREDARFRHFPNVTGPPYVRFLAECPLVSSDGMMYGMLKIVDRKPRSFVAEQLAILTTFAEMVVRKLEERRLLELRHKAEEAAQGQATPLVRDLQAMDEPLLLANLGEESWELKWLNRGFARTLGIAQGSAAGRDLLALLKVAGTGADREEALADCDVAILLNKPFSLTVLTLEEAPGGSAAFGTSKYARRVRLAFRPASQGLPSSGGFPCIGIPGSISSLAEGCTHDSLAPGCENLYWAQVEKEAEAGVGAAGAAGPAAAGAEAGAAAKAPAPAPGKSSSLSISSRIFDQVKLGTLLGSGSYGRVHRGFWRGAEVAVKVLEIDCEPITDGTVELSAEKHSALLEALLGRDYTHHPCLVQTYDLGLRPVSPFDPADPPQGTVKHELWVISELYNRGTLADAIVKGRLRLTPSDPSSPVNMLAVLATAQDVAGGMSMLHDVGIVHSDLSGNNVLLKAASNSRRFSAAVSDFGLSRICQDINGRRTATVGTVTHQPPELLTEGLLTPAADVYAYGVLLFSMYCGELPFAGESPYLVIHKVASGTSCPLELPEGAPEGFKDLFQRCVAYDRTQRPTFDQVLDLLAPLLEKAEAEAPPPPSPPARAASGSPSLMRRAMQPPSAGSAGSVGFGRAGSLVPAAGSGSVSSVPGA